MAITINGGTGVITGVSVGGLPDGVVDSGTLATNSVDSDELINGAVDTSHLATATRGKVVQVVNTTTSALATGTTTLPTDDTIPQITEGDEYMTRAITPTNASNLLRIDVVFHAALSVADRLMCVALFQDSTAGALAAGHHASPIAGANRHIQISITHYMTAGTTSSTTFQIGS